MESAGGRLKSMAQPIAPDYGQQFLFPPALEDWVSADHPVRFLREFVDQLDLAALGFAMPTVSEGRPPYHPSLLLKIWLYGYYHRIRSTRKLEMACREHLSLLWLSGLIQPDHNSLWRFWRDHQQALRQVFKQTVQVALRDTIAAPITLPISRLPEIFGRSRLLPGTSRRFCRFRRKNRGRMRQTVKRLSETSSHAEHRLRNEPGLL